jgi:hypothetical protein
MVGHCCQERRTQFKDGLNAQGCDVQRRQMHKQSIAARISSREYPCTDFFAGGFQKEKRFMAPGVGLLRVIP